MLGDRTAIHARAVDQRNAAVRQILQIIALIAHAGYADDLELCGLRDQCLVRMNVSGDEGIRLQKLCLIWGKLAAAGDKQVCLLLQPPHPASKQRIAQHNTIHRSLSLFDNVCDLSDTGSAARNDVSGLEIPRRCLILPGSEGRTEREDRAAAQHAHPR